MALAGDEEIARDLTVEALNSTGNSSWSLAYHHANEPEKLGTYVGKVYTAILTAVKAANNS
jgi:hypothetical protein